jgi:D-alanyl-lipoteichoic acid acyltransferase DltB (MBOAT superfamily)/lysophospholipase L1-like esterase
MISSRRKAAYFLLSFFLVISLFSILQKAYLDPLNMTVFPKWENYLPDYFYLFRNEPNQENVKNQSELLSAGNNYIYLSKFYDSLNELEIKKDKVVRILHFGDSIIWADILTAELQRKFQKDFGDGGRGIVPSFYRLERALKNHSNPTNESAFKIEKVLPWGAYNPKLGFLGESFKPINNFSTSNQILGENLIPWKKLSVIYRQEDTKLQNQLTLKIHSKELEIINKKFETTFSECKLEELSLNDAKNISISFDSSTGTFPQIDAMILETERGVSYSPIARMGIEINDLLTVSEKNFECGIKALKPDLVIFQFGVNESQNLWTTSKKDPATYKKGYKDIISRYKKYSPNSSILLISISERIRQVEGGTFVTMPEMLTIHSIQKQIADEEGVAFYDSLNALGGKGQSKVLFEKGIIQEDRTHFTRAGGDYLGGLIYNSIYNGYQSFIGHKEKQREEHKAELQAKTNKAVNFNSPAYYIFLCLIFFITYQLLNFPKLKLIFLLTFSYYFYISWNLWAVGLILFSTLVDYYASILIDKSKLKGHTGKIFLISSLVINLGLLYAFKYFNFTLEILNQIKVNGSYFNFSYYDVILPVGISFYTFQTLSYTIDVYRGNLTAEKNFLKFALYVAFFPQLVAGPIVRAKDFIPGINSFIRHFAVSEKRFSEGIFLIICGLTKKVAADFIGSAIVNKVYSTPEMYSSTETLAGIYGFAFQIYGDFSGYSDIAIGSAMLLGFHLTENFNRPYVSTSITDFWKRWHISLGAWFRDYLYIPLGGNRNHIYFNLLVTMFLCGLWHGAGLNYIVWGLYHGSFLIVERYFKNKSVIVNKFYFPIINAIKIFITFHIVLFGWVLFRVNSLSQIKQLYESITAQNWTYINLDISVLYILIGFTVIHITPIRWKEIISDYWSKSTGSFQGFLTACLVVLFFHLGTDEIQNFIYFQF